MISTRYAKALLRFSCEKGDEDRVYAEMEALADTYVCVPAFQETLLNPVLEGQVVIDLLSAACRQNREKASAVSVRFFQLVVRQGRIAYMMFIARSYLSLYRRKKHLVRGKLTVPVAVSEEVRQRLKSVIAQRTGAHVDFAVAVDETIGGGFILDYDSYRLDASLRSQLEKISRALKN